MRKKSIFERSNIVRESRIMRTKNGFLIWKTGVIGVAEC